MLQQGALAIAPKATVVCIPRALTPKYLDMVKTLGCTTRCMLLPTFTSTNRTRPLSVEKLLRQLLLLTVFEANL